MKIGIVNYSLGNVGSVYSAFKFFKQDVDLVHNSDELDNCDVIVLAGVGNFKTAAGKLKEYKLWEKLNHEVLVKKKPVLGICLGMQLFADLSFEGGEIPGFGWIKGKVEKIDGTTLRVPNIGWNEVIAKDKDLFSDIDNHYFYYMHSYRFIPEDPSVITAFTNYGGTEIVAAVKKDNIVGVQFHPEKSQGDGLRFLKNFLEVYSC